MMKLLLGLLFAAGAAQAVDLPSPVRDAITHDLRDPAAAQFREVRAVTSGEARGYCGEINAKNAMGAYTGFVPFYFATTVNGGTLWRADDEGGGPLVVQAMCAG